MNWMLCRASDGQIVISTLEVADGYWSRLRGLQGRPPLPIGAALLVVPCASIHTFWMRFTIDVIGLDHLGAVTAVKSQVRPWRLALMPAGTHAVLEVLGGTAPVDLGDRLELCSQSGPCPKSLRFLAFPSS